jgi:hypothetical protein
MAWPVTARFLNAVANVSNVSAAFGNAVQDAIINVVGGAHSIKALWVDGVGDVASAVAAGCGRFLGLSAGSVALKVDGGDIQAASGFFNTGWNVGSTVTPINSPTTSNSIATGSASAESFAIGHAKAHTTAGTIHLDRAVNLRSIARNSAGSYTLVFNYTPSVGSGGGGGTPFTSVWVQVSTWATSGSQYPGGHYLGGEAVDDGSGRIKVNLYDQHATPADVDFYVSVWAQ